MATFDWANLGLGNRAAAAGSATVTEGGRTTDLTLSESGNLRYFSTYGPGSHLVTTRSTGPDDATMEFSNPIDNLSFDIYDLEAGGTWQDQVTITAFDPDGNEIPVTFSNLNPAIHVQLDANTVTSTGSTSTSVYDGAATGSNDSISVSIDGPIGSVIVSFSGGASRSSHQIVGIGDLTFDIICFTSGTQIATIGGQKPIEKLEIGDLIVTRDNGLRPIRWIGKRTVSADLMQARPNLTPVTIKKHTFGPGLPDQDMRVSPQHRMHIADPLVSLNFEVNEVLVPAKALCNDHSIVVDHSRTDVTYFHIMFDEHEIVLADSIWSESFHPGAMSLDAIDEAGREELLDLFPELRSNPAGYGATARKVLKVKEAALLLP